MKVLNAALSALVASTLIAAPVAAQAAPAADRTGASVKGENIAGLGWGWIFAVLIVIGMIVIIASDSNEKPKSP